MQRWATILVDVPAKTMVNILTIKNSSSLCEFRVPKDQREKFKTDDKVIVKIPNINFAGDKLKPAKKIKAATVVVTPPVVIAEETVPAGICQADIQPGIEPIVAPETIQAPIPAVIETAVVETAPVLVEETAV